jgi:hypothetical protein
MLMLVLLLLVMMMVRADMLTVLSILNYIPSSIIIIECIDQLTGAVKKWTRTNWDGVNNVDNNRWGVARWGSSQPRNDGTGDSVINVCNEGHVAAISLATRLIKVCPRSMPILASQ